MSQPIRVVLSESTEREQNVTTITSVPWRRYNTWLRCCASGLSEEQLWKGWLVTDVQHIRTGSTTHASQQVICLKGVKRGVFSQAMWGCDYPILCFTSFLFFRGLSTNSPADIWFTIMYDKEDRLITWLINYSSSINFILWQWILIKLQQMWRHFTKLQVFL